MQSKRETADKALGIKGTNAGGRMRLILYVLFISTATHAHAETVAGDPAWEITKVDAPGGANGSSHFFILQPTDGRPAVTINSALATAALNGEILPGSLYDRVLAKQNARKPAGNRTPGYGLQVPDPIFSTATKDDQPAGYKPGWESDAGKKEKTSKAESADSGLPASSSSSAFSSYGQRPAGQVSAAEAMNMWNAAQGNPTTASAPAPAAARPVNTSGSSAAPYAIQPDAGAPSSMSALQGKMRNVSSTSVAPEPPPAPLAPEPALLTSCAQAAAANAVQSAIQNVSFPATTGTGCAWGLNENLGRGSGRLRARTEQVVPLHLPAGAVLCEMSISSSEGTIRYDDLFFLTFNGYVIAANSAQGVSAMDKETVSAGARSVDIHKYDWLRYRNISAAQANYCAGESQGISSCSWPSSERSGAFHLRYNPELVRRISEKTAQWQQKFAFVVTGDDDGSDCQHTGLNLNVAVKYFIRGSRQPGN